MCSQTACNKESRTGGGSPARFTNRKNRGSLITDHGYNNFVFPNHENKQVRYSF